MDRRKSIATGIGRALAAVSLGAMPLAAQNNSVTQPPPPANSSDIGPGELSNFSLNGTVTQPAERPARPAFTPPASSSPPASSAAPPSAAPATRETRPEPSTAPRAAPATTTASDNDLFRRPPTLPDSTGASTGAEPSPAFSEPLAAPPPISSGASSLLPWIIGLLAIAGGGLLWFGRQRRQQRYSAAGNAPIDILRSPLPDTPMPAPRPDPIPSATARKPLPTTLMPPPPNEPRVQPRAESILPGGVVSTGLRPWIEVELSPDRALLDEKGAAIAFEVTLFNSGNAAARDVIIEAKLLNAGAGQDVELSAFFTADTTVGDPIPQIAPYARIPLRSAVRLPREAISEYDYEGRKLFMPLVAISVRYRWSSGDGQSAAGFLVGQGANGQDKLAPLRTDRGARSWNGLGARRYEKGVRR